MMINDVEIIPITVPREWSYNTSLKQDRDDYEHVLIRLDTDSGKTGWGEVSPAPYWPHGISQKSCKVLLDELVPTILDRKLNRIPRIIEDLENQMSGMTFPISGIDLALHDALGQELGLPVYELLGGAKKDEPRVSAHYSIGIKAPDEMASEAVDASKKGFKDFKIKVGGQDHKEEVEGVRRVAENIDGARIRIDANQAWEVDEAIRKIREFNKVADGLEYMEQPVVYDDISGLSRVRSSTSPPIMADEACSSPRDVIKIAQKKAADIVNIKLAKTGGLSNAKKVAAVAAANGLTAFVGSMGELDVGTAARSHFGLSTPVVTYPSGTSNKRNLLISNREDWSVNGISMHIPSKSGLGVDISEDKIEEYRNN